MYHRTFTWGKFRSQTRHDQHFSETIWIIALLSAALILLLTNLSTVALRDWDEGIVAQVAKEIYQAPNSLRWIFPTQGDLPYYNKPPLIHWLIAISYHIGGINELTARLPSALLTAISVPLFYGIGREIFAYPTPARIASVIYLTSLPIIRIGRLAMLEGAVLCFMMLMIWSLLRARRDLRWGLGAGIGFGLICLTKGMLGLLLGGIAIIFLIWDTPRLLTSLYLWSGIILGSLPVILWYWAQLLQYQQVFISDGIVNQSLKRIWAPVSNNSGPIWYYILELLKYTWPWLVFIPSALKLTWSERNLNWSKLVITWFGTYFIIISLMSTKLPWYLLPVYPPIALAIGAYLDEIWNAPPSHSYPNHWGASFLILALVALTGCIYFANWSLEPNWYIVLSLLTSAFTFMVTAILIYRQDWQFFLVLTWGTYLALLLFVMSGNWIWELKEAYPVKPVASIINQHTPINKTIYTSYPHDRPSLNFYSDRIIKPLPFPELKEQWLKNPHPFLLLDQKAILQLHITKYQTLGSAEGWLLISK